MTPAPLGPHSSVCALIPHFRCEQWLDQAIESLLDQTRPPQAIVVVDDGSGNPPVDIAAGYPEVTLMASDDNGGPYRLVQAVIDLTHHDAYLFQDADDWSAPDRVEVLLDEAARTGAELVGSHEMRVLVDEGDVVAVEYPLDVNAVLRERPASFPLLHPTSMIAGALVRRLGGFASAMRFSGDAELLRRAGHVARVANADHFGYFRRKRRGSLTCGSETALGSPARLAVQQALAQRAHANARSVAAGRPPDLTPWRTAPPPRLRHLCGPPLDGPRVAPRQRPRPAAGAQGGPVFVVGAPRSGHHVVALALAQHPNLALLHDSRWLARAAADVELRAAEEAAPPPPAFRERMGGALSSLLAGRGPSPRMVAAGTDLLPVAHALATLFPEGRFVHVVRSAEQVAAALATAPAEGGSYYSPDAAWRAWIGATEAGLALEEALGAAAVLRVDYDDLVLQPRAALGRCLSFLGEKPATACVRPLADMAYLDLREAPRPPPALVERARRLARAVAVTAPAGDGDQAARQRLSERFRRDWSERRGGESLVERMRRLLTDVVPEGSTVAVISRGDPRLVDLPGRAGWHLPQAEGGIYAGYHPADSAEAVRHLVGLQRLGAEFLALPASCLWWLTYYDGLRRHLEDTATLVAYQEEVGAVFRLAPEPAVASGEGPAPPRIVAVAPARPVGAAS